MRDNSVEILFQSFLQEAPVSSSGMGRDGHSSMCIHHFLCRPGVSLLERTDNIVGTLIELTTSVISGRNEV